MTVYPGSRGRYVAEVLLGLDEAGIATVAGRTHGLMQGDPLRPDVQRWVLGVTREAASLRLRSRGATSDRVYRGAAACRPCHEAITDAWSKSAHAGAYETLETAGLADAEECVRCHVTGFAEVPVMRPGGADLRGVQCEACHVVPDHHPEPIHVPAVEPGECRRCHDPENSPDYDPASYWRRILHE